MLVLICFCRSFGYGKIVCSSKPLL